MGGAARLGLALAAAWIAVGGGCAHFRRPSAAVEPSSSEKPGVVVIEETPEVAGGGGTTAVQAVSTNGTESFTADSEKTLTLQSAALAELCDTYDDDTPWGVNRFTCWLDRMHEGLYRRMDNAVRRLDTLWLPAGSEYDYKVSTFRLSTSMRVGGRGSEKDFDAKVRFKAKLALPRIQRELYVFIDNAGRDSLPGTDPLEQESDTRVGLSAARQFMNHSEIDTSGGVRLRSTGPVAYGDLDWRWTWTAFRGEMQFVPSVFYYSDVGVGQMTTMRWTRPIGTRRALQLLLAERSTEATAGLECEQTVRYAWYRSDHRRGWVARASVFPYLKSSTLYWDSALVSLTWRDAIYKKWTYVTLTPQVIFAREDDYEPRASLRIGLEILFGGKPGDIL